MRVTRTGKLWTEKKVADFLGISEATAYKLMQSQEIPSLLIEGEKRYRTTKPLVKHYLKKLKRNTINESNFREIQDNKKPE